MEKTNSKEIEKLEKQIEKRTAELKANTYERGRQAPIEESEPQTRLSSREIAKSNDIYLKPEKTLNDNQKFNEKWAEEWTFQKEYVHFIAEHKELIGDVIEIWTHPFGGKGAQFWKVPTNKPVWGPRYLAESIKRKRYVRYVTEQQNHITGQNSVGSEFSNIIAEKQVQRLDANPVAARRSVFMGSGGF